MLESAYTSFPTLDGSPMLYHVLEIKGLWHEDTFCLDVTYRDRYPFDLIWQAETAIFPCFSGIKIQWLTQLGKDQGALYNRPAISSNGLYYIGEGINENGWVIDPPEALLTYNPIAGETITEHSRVFASPTDNTVVDGDMHWAYRTIGHYAHWGPFPDVWRTGLHEYESRHVYNYAFANGLGIVDLWHGSIDANNNVQGIEFWRVFS